MNIACINEDCLELGNIVMDVKVIKVTNLNISVLSDILKMTFTCRRSEN